MYTCNRQNMAAYKFKLIHNLIIFAVVRPPCGYPQAMLFSSSKLILTTVHTVAYINQSKIHSSQCQWTFHFTHTVLSEWTIHTTQYVKNSYFSSFLWRNGSIFFQEKLLKSAISASEISDGKNGIFNYSDLLFFIL